MAKRQQTSSSFVKNAETKEKTRKISSKIGSSFNSRNKPISHFFTASGLTVPKIPFTSIPESFTKDYNVAVEVPMDGNCMFACLAIGLGKSITLHGEIRQEIINYMREHPDLVSV